MKTIYTIKAICLTSFLAVSAVVSAQEVNEETQLNREMTLEREYDPSVQDANKVNTLPKVREPEVNKRPIDYANYNLALDPEKEIHVLPSGKVMTDILYNKRRGYFNFGIGTYTNINGDLGYHILSTEKDQLNIFFSHRSSNGKVKYLQVDEKVKAKLNDNLGGINYRHVFDNVTMKLNAKYGYTGFNYYGYPTNSASSFLDRETIQSNRRLHIGGGVASNDNDPFGYFLDLDYANFSQGKGIIPDYNGVKEHTIGAKLGANASFGGNQLIAVEGKLNVFSYDTPKEWNFDLDNYAEITLNPYYKMDGDLWRVKVGANVMFITGNQSKVFLSPDIHADIELADKTVLYLNADGRIQSNSLYEITEICRYVAPGFRPSASRTWLDAKLGLKSGALSGFWFDIFTGYKITDWDMFFMPYGIVSSSFINASSGWGSEILPLNVDAKAFQAGLNLKYAYQQLFDVSLKGVYYNWNMGTDLVWGEMHPYSKPDFEMGASLDVRPIDKLSLLLDYTLLAGRYAGYGLRDDKLKNLSELNVTGTYTINDTFGAYVKVNNLLFQKYEMYYGYPLQGFNIMAGININF